ncbi:PD-(D/E)XK nuclease family protein [Sorangium sp. So ce118]
MGSRRHRLSASKVALASRCLHWARPDVPESVDADTASRRCGSAFHDVAEKHPDVDMAAVVAKWNLRDGERAKVEELYDAWREWWPEYLGGRTVEREVAFAWDTATNTARRLPRCEHRDYSDCSWTEIPMTVDALILGDGRTDVEAEVLDLKTSFEDISAEEHAQLEANALAVATLLGLDAVAVTIANVSADGVRPNSSRVGGFDFDAIAGRLARMVEAVPTAQPKPGPHCASMWCPALGTCAATRVTAESLVRARPDLSAVLARGIQTHEEAYAIKSALKPAQAFLKQLEQMAVAWAEEHGGIRTPDGGLLKRVPQTKRTIDAGNKALRSRLFQMFGDDAANAIKTKETVSLDAVRRLAKAKAPRGSKARAEAEAIEALEATGGVRMSVFQKWSDEEKVDDE